ncbi:MAG: PP2C family protein-serine/threonine phosphatase, partial [Phycisphaerae bacterium]
KRISDLAALLEVTRQLAVTIELPALLSSIEQAARRVLNCERATVFLYDPQRQELRSKIATGLDELRISAEAGISGQVVRTRQPINVPDAYADPRFNAEVDRRTGCRTRNMLTFPLIDYDGQLVGVLQLLNKIGGAFDAYDQMLAQSLSAQVAVALQRQRLLEQYAEKQRMQRDLDIARRIQEDFLPSADPRVPGFDIAGWNRPADETGGDYYDFLDLDDGSLVIAVADATGHGIGPALLAAECRAMLRAIVSLTQDLPSVLAQTNKLLCADLPGGRFVTAFVGLLQPSQSRLVYISAGHGPVLFYEAAGRNVRQIEASALPLGIVPSTDFAPAEQLRFAPGDMMVVMTDGFFEACGADGRQFGIDRIGQLIGRYSSISAGALIQQIYRQVSSFTDSTRQRDDLTAVVIKRL